MVFYVDETFRQKIYGEFNGVTFYLRANNGDEAGKKTCQFSIIINNISLKL